MPWGRLYPEKFCSTACAAFRRRPAGQPYRSFGGLLDHLAALTRNQVRLPGTSTEIRCSPGSFPPRAAPRLRADQRGTPIPLTPDLTGQHAQSR
jgi:hypothetical protein